MATGTVYVVSQSSFRPLPTCAEAERVLPETVCVIAAGERDAMTAVRAALGTGDDVVLLGEPGPAMEACFGCAPVVRLGADDLMDHWRTVGRDLNALDALADGRFPSAQREPGDETSPPLDLARLSTLERLSALSLARWWKAERARF